MSKIELRISIDVEEIEQTIAKSKDLANDEQGFLAISELMKAKEQLDNVNAQWDEVERTIKEALNRKAKALLGKEWTALNGQGFQLRRSLTGTVYQLTDPFKVPKELLEEKITVDTKAVSDYIKANSKLPEGLSYNPNRNESIRIKLC